MKDRSSKMKGKPLEMKGNLLKMKDKRLEKYLQQSLGQEVKQPDRLEETVQLCTGMMRETLAKKSQEEPRIGFMQYLSDVFRFEGAPVLGLHAAVLFIICLILSTIVNFPEYIPVFIPLFALAAMPALFRSQYYGMSEIEAATRASGAQIVLAKLVLAGAANLVCMTVLVSVEVLLQNSYEETGRIVLYCFVPYLICMTGTLRLVRLRRREGIQICVVSAFGFCVFWGVLAKSAPWLYEISAFGIWFIAFLCFAALFGKEIYFIITMRKEGKMYGIIA